MPLPILPNPNTQTESDGASLRAKLTAIITPYKTVVEALQEQVIGFSAAPGVLTTGVGVSRFRWPWAVAIVGVTAAVNTAPTGTAIILDVKKNGSTIYATTVNRPTIAISTFATSTEPTPDITAMVAGDYITIDRVQVGSAIPGSDLTVFVRYRRV